LFLLKDPTYKGILNKVTNEHIPIWWEDIEDGNNFEKTIMLIYNRVRFLLKYYYANLL